jgi:hypothetical protein
MISGRIFMTVTLTPDLAKAIGIPTEETIHLKDPTTNQEYVLVPAQIYERLSRLLADDDGLSMTQVGILIEEAMREDDQEDPLLATYQNYKRKQ